MHFDEVSSSEIVRPENLSKGQLAQIQSQLSGVKRQQSNLSSAILQPTEAVREQQSRSRIRTLYP